MTPNEDIELSMLAKDFLPSASYTARNPRTQDHHLNFDQPRTRLRLLHPCRKHLAHQCYKMVARRYSDTARLQGNRFSCVHGHLSHASWAYGQAAYSSTYSKSCSRSRRNEKSIDLYHGTSHIHKAFEWRNLKTFLL